MAGTIPLSLTQQFDEFGKPLSGGLLYIYQAGTVSTPQQPYQDAGLSIVQPNPIVLDAAGRVPQFFLADGYIKVRLDNKNGITQLARDNILVIGPSAGGGGGGAAVDPTTILQTGMVSVFYGTAIVSGFVRANGRTIGSATSGASERANSDCNALFQFLWNADPNLVVTPSRGASSAADWAANKAITLPDWRGRTIAGLDDMGNSAAGRLTASYWGGSGIVLGQSGGAESNTLLAAQCVMPQHQHNVYSRDTGHGHGFANIAYRQAGGSGINFYTVFGPDGYTTLTVDAAPIVKNSNAAIVVSSVNGGAADNLTALNPASGPATPHANVQPTMLATIYLKL